MGTGQTIALGARHPVGWIYDLGFLEHPECYPHSMNQLAFITKTVVSRSEKIITISEYVKKEIVKRFRVDPEKIYVCYPGIQRQKLIAKNTMVKDRPYFLFVGAFKPGKNIPFLLRSFSKAVRRGLQSDLILVGSDRWMNENIQGIIARERLNSRVTVKGYIDEKSLQELYTGAKATLIPSLVEGFGFPAVESFHCGTPVIGSTAGSLPEVIGNGGVCIDPWDEEGFVQVLLQFEKTDVRGAYKKGIQAQVEKFTQEKFAAHVSDVIDLI
jgi:glycosyltransferase involved in cell wall biosynthesis